MKRCSSRMALPALRLIFLLSWACTWCPQGRALDPQKAITQYARDEWLRPDRLPARPGQAIAQTPDGYLWLGTPAGLVRFDGVRFTLVPTGPQSDPAYENVSALCACADGSLWVGTKTDGLRRFRDGKKSTYGEKEKFP